MLKNIECYRQQNLEDSITVIHSLLDASNHLLSGRESDLELSAQLAILAQKKVAELKVSLATNKQPAPPHPVNPNELGTISSRIQLARENLGLSEADLAGMLGLIPECIADWEDGNCPVEATYITPLATALKCDPLWLLTGNDTKADWGNVLEQRAKENDSFSVRGADVQKDGVHFSEETEVTTHQPNERWTIDFIDDDRFLFQRELNGKLNESYRIVERDLAAVYATAIIQGLEPPRQLREKDGEFISHQVRRQGSGSQQPQDQPHRDKQTD